jgi:TonB family protein
MSAPLLYRPGSKWQTAVAFATALLIHVGAVALAERKQPAVDVPTISEKPWIFVDPVDDTPPVVPSPPEDVDVAPPPPPESDSEFFDQAEATPPPRRRANDLPPIVRPPTNAASRGPSGSPKAFAITAPRPEYPYEARRQRLTGSGVATLTIDVATGAVINVTMSRSTGSAVLDNATINGLRRWRFRPGTVSRVQTPITYTLTGASY